MKKIFTLIIAVVSSVCLSAQPFSTGKRTITFTDNSRSDRAVPTEIYYPATSAGDNVPVAAGTVKFPVVVFGHGFVISTSSYKWLADSLVRNGYIVAFPTTEDGILPSHTDFGLDLLFLCTQVTALNDSANSFLYNRVIKRAAISGHSMGGGASFLAAAGATLVPSVKAVFNFAAAETIPSATTAAYLDLKPTLVFSGSSDCIAPDSVQEAMYNNILLACKTYIDITNGLHCQFANNNFLCQAGQLVSGCNSSPINTQTVFSKTMSLLLPFLDYYLKNTCQRGLDFVNTYNVITGVTKRRSCLPYPSCGVVPVKLLSFTGKLDNDKASLYWSTASEENFDHHFVVERSADGNTFDQIAEVKPKASNGAGASYTSIDAFPFAGYNFYRLKIVDRDGSFAYSNIVKLETRKKPVAVTQLFPNPVGDLLHVQLQSDKSQTVKSVLLDITGKQVAANVNTLTPGLNNTVVPFSKVARGTYILQYRNSDGSNLGTYKIIKN